MYKIDRVLIVMSVCTESGFLIAALDSTYNVNICSSGMLCINSKIFHMLIAASLLLHTRYRASVFIKD